MITQEQLPMVAILSMNDSHLEEIMFINKLESAVQNNELEAIAQTLKELQEHTSLHFIEEEKMMKEALFSAFEDHKKEHDSHLHTLGAVLKYFEKNQDIQAISAYVQGNLIPWVLDHMKTLDTDMAQSLKEATS